MLIGDGEKAKHLRSVDHIYRELAARKIDRAGTVAAFGGGVVGDVAGFAAATYLRGVSFIQIPTTLVAQVDSAIGGKVGVNLPAGKNLAGAFHAPAMVLVDPTPDSEQVESKSRLPELVAMPDRLAQARASRVPAGVRVFLIDATSVPEVPFATEAFRRLRLANRTEIEAESLEYRRWLATIPGSRLIVTNRSGHNIAQEEPAIVVDTIRDAVSGRAAP